jgi:hypothetical protein
MWANLLLDLLVPRRNTFEGSDPLKSCTTSPGLVGQHASNTALKDLGRCTVVEWTTSRVYITPLAKEPQELQFIPEIKKYINLMHSQILISGM